MGSPPEVEAGNDPRITSGFEEMIFLNSTGARDGIWSVNYKHV